MLDLGAFGRLNLAQVRFQVPSWTWKAMRDGFGWIYEGVKDGRKVVVRAYSSLCGFLGDDFFTSWRVHEENGPSETWALWSMREALSKKQTPA